MAIRFHGPKLKIDRANRHILELNEEITRFSKVQPYRLIADEYLAETKQYFFRCLVPAIPHTWSPIVGDAVHNLRAALDLLACELVRLNDGNTDKVYFPFCHDGDYLETRIKERYIDRAAPEVVDIVRSLKPYKGGNRDLYSLHELDLCDKHQTLIPILPTYYELACRGASGNMTIKVYVTSGTSFVLPGEEGDFKIGEEINPSLPILFGNGPRKGDAILPTLHQLSQLTNGIIATFNEHFG